MNTIQQQVFKWVRQCFGDNVAKSRPERRERFAEEALELMKASGMTKDEVYRLAEYVYNRPTGEFSQEVAGVCITLDALAASEGVDRERVVLKELDRVKTKTLAINQKQLQKPRVSIVNDVYPEREWQYLPTDRAAWRVRGETDPHGDAYDALNPRPLCCGHYTDDELANAVYLEPSFRHLTAAKERIRYLSRVVQYHEDNLAALKATNIPSKEG
jgi:hypothetical protein